MKKTILLLIFIPAISFAQKSPVPMVDGKVIYSDTQIVNETKKDVLYGKAKLWFANAFKSSKDVIQLDDKEGGVILGKGIFVKKEIKIITPIEKTYKFTVKIQSKDGKYKAEIYDIDYMFEMPSDPNNRPSTMSLNEYYGNPKIFKKDGTLKPNVEKFSNESNDIFNNLLSSIKKAMTENIKSDF